VVARERGEARRGQRGRERERDLEPDNIPLKKRLPIVFLHSSSHLLDLLDTRDLFMGASYLALERERARDSREELVMIGEMIIFGVIPLKANS
jgi:hypothetical protein